MTMAPMALVTLRKDLTNDEFNKVSKDIKAVRGVHACDMVQDPSSGRKSLTITFDGSVMTKMRVWGVPGVVFVQQPRI